MKMFLWISCLLLVACAKKQDDPGPSGYEYPGEDTATQTTIRVMTYNVHYCTPYVPAGNTTPDVQATANAIKEASPDLVLLQELDDKTNRADGVDQLALLSQYTGMAYYYFGSAQAYDGGYYGIGLLSRFEIKDPHTYLLPKIAVPDSYVGQRALCTAYIDFPGGHRYTVATTHLDLTIENRRAQVPVIDSILSLSPYPVILGGDFNATPGSETINDLDAAAFTRSCTDNCLTIPSTGPTRQLDYITSRPSVHFGVVSHKVYTGVTASDHLPVLTVYEMK